MTAAERRGPAAFLDVVGLGAQASLGLEPHAIAAAVRAGLNRFQESEWLTRKADGSRIVAAHLSALDPLPSSFERMRRMGIAAARQALAPILERSPPPAAVPLLVSVPPFRPGLARDAGAKLVQELAAALPPWVDLRNGGMFDSGSEGALAALAHAAALVSERQAEVCLVGGVESWRDLEALHWLEALGRLKGEGAPSGLVPGEGAAFLLVCGDAVARRAKLAPLARVSTPSQAVEPNPWYQGRPCTGEGLTDAIRAALEGSLPPGGRAGTTWGDLNGEHWRSDEWTYAYLRTAELHGEPLRLRHPADCLGDLGAASAAMLVALAALDLDNPRTSPDSALVFAAADTRPYRSACIVRRPEETR